MPALTRAWANSARRRSSEVVGEQTGSRWCGSRSPRCALRSTGHRQLVRGRQPSEAQAHKESRRSSPSRSTAPRSASKAAATAVRAVPRWPAPPPRSRAPPWPPLQTTARLTSHPGEGGGEGSAAAAANHEPGIQGPGPEAGRGGPRSHQPNLRRRQQGGWVRRETGAAAGP